MSASKECRRCREAKPLEAFYPDLRCRDGVTSRCRACTSTVAREYEKRRKERLARERHTSPPKAATGCPETSACMEEALSKLAAAIGRWTAAKDTHEREGAAAAVVFRAEQLLEVQG